MKFELKNAQLWLIAMTLGASSAYAKTHQNSELKEFLKEFKSNPSEVMDQLPPKEAEDDFPGSKPFNSEYIEGNTFVEKKDEFRKKFLSIPGRAGMAYNDNPSQLVDNGANAIRNLKEMDERNLLSATLTTKPWSDDYWAIATGILGKRYEDYNAPYGMDYEAHRNYVLENPVQTYLETGKAEFLSPSEKYDLLVGDVNFSMTQKMWSEGKYYFDNHGEVETWMGICHGWAAAAYMLERPTNKITVKSGNGKHDLTFFPSDIKSLGSLIWANARARTKFSGGRCDTKDPKKDENGRILDQKCFDTNPGSWHISVVNQIGINDRSFIIDATYDYEVWNQPVYSYSYLYFNPITGESSENYEDVAINIFEHTEDVFKTYRDPNAKKLVGVQMRIQYIAETQPSHNPVDNPSYDYANTVTYRYDLELSNDGTILGGEWYSNAHPDFLWTPPVGEKATSAADQYVQGEWKVGEPVPAQWQMIAPYASKSGLPLAKVLDGLIERSRAANNQ